MSNGFADSNEQNFQSRQHIRWNAPQLPDVRPGKFPLRPVREKRDRICDYLRTITLAVEFTIQSLSSPEEDCKRD